MSTPALNSSAGSILIVDDSAEWRTRVREILEEQPELRIVAEACDGVQAVHRAARLNPDLVLLDIGMPLLNGLDVADQIRRISPRSKIVFLTQENDTGIRDAALAAGAHGFLLKINAQRKLLSQSRLCCATAIELTEWLRLVLCNPNTVSS